MSTFAGELHPHQTVGLAFLQAERRAILADEVGLGKTVQVASLIGWLADSGDLREPAPDSATLPPQRGKHLPRLPVLWITTAGLVAQTKAELERFLPYLGIATSEAGTVGNRADRERMAAFLAAHPDGPDVLIINNDLATRRVDHLTTLRPRVVVVDEASALKGAGARYEAVKGLCDAAERVVVMTATPYENDPLELWAVMSLAGLPGLPDAESFGAMPVHAPEMDVFNPHAERRNLLTMTRNFVRWMSDQPDTVLGRVPFYTERYFKHYEELGARELARSGELSAQSRASIEKVARHRAIMDTQKTMYDTARFTGAHDRVARMGFAFLGAWEDSMRAWGRLFYDDPSRIGKLTKTWYAPDRAGFIVDENGDRVKPGDDSREKWIVLPISIPGTQGEEFKLRKDSFNSMFQGEVPWAPGFSPMVQVPVATIAAKTFPEVADPNFEIGGVKVGESPLFRQMFGFGVPKTGVTADDTAASVLRQFEPGWVKRAIDLKSGNSQQFSDAYAMALNSAIIEARQDGKDVNTKDVQEWADAKARKTARSIMILEFAANWGLGLSGEGATKADFYRQRYREISSNADALKARGTTVNEEFLRQHPEAAGLNWSFSQNETGINATLKVEDRSRKYAKDISKAPEFGWFYVGSDNVGGEFSSAVYSAQFNREGVPGSGEAWRSRQNPAQIRSATNAQLGWDSWTAVSLKVDSILEQRGLHSVNQKGAEDLKQIKAEFRDGLAAENPDWFKDYSSFDPNRLQRFLSQVAVPATKDGRLKGRSDVKRLADYLEVRQEAMKMANDNGYSLGSDKAAPLRAVLAEFGTNLAREDLGFGQTWDRILSREVDD
ncbi:SNF2 family N-terminal domain-containing protein [Pedococcus dokdonensis]|uniref:SNF2 family N-terminal domain-containing protein n=1 Tax=Pedococcus dokdonensis TaxID=443156 RepID=A0A1H0SYF9_9MICO|nr:SNF2-related protein [Pedococcus dokdonensis]SDP46621.1 SNF2 family N-terminal domain-containing protein [Pedococcus dokdonensis]